MSILKDALNPFAGYSKSKKILGNIGQNLSAIVSLRPNVRRSPTDEGKIEIGEAIRRYRNARLTAIALFLMLVWASTNFVLANSLQSVLVGGLSSLLCGAYYLAICRELFKVRLAVANWSERETLSVTWIDFINAIAEKPSNILPKKVK